MSTALVLMAAALLLGHYALDWRYARTRRFPARWVGLWFAAALGTLALAWASVAYGLWLRLEGR